MGSDVMSSDVDAAASAIEACASIALACHVSPDGDALGSMLALHHLCLAAGKRSVASWPVVGTFFGPTPLFLRTVMTALPRPSFASTVALMLRLAVYCCWNMVCPAALSQPGATLSPTRV